MKKSKLGPILEMTKFPLISKWSRAVVHKELIENCRQKGKISNIFDVGERKVGIFGPHHITQQNAMQNTNPNSMKPAIPPAAEKENID